MAGSKSKNKGNSWERDIAKFLSDLYNESFIRAPHSGAYIGGTNNHRKTILDNGQIRSFKGDIIPPSSWSKFNAEAKSYKDFPFHQLFSGTVKQLEEWINQCMDVADTGDCNILFLKFNRKGKYVCIQNHDNYANLTFTCSFTYNSEKYGTWTFVEFDTFFTANKDLFKSICQ